MLRIIDNKRVEMTNDEFDLFQKICRSYDNKTMKGEDLFKNLFEVNKDGIIIFLKPPSTSFTSMEVYLFCCSLMVQQHLRNSCQQSDELAKESASQVKELLKQGYELIAELKAMKNDLKK